jgi:hypothetical protein
VLLCYKDVKMKALNENSQKKNNRKRIHAQFYLIYIRSICDLQSSKRTKNEKNE